MNTRMLPVLFMLLWGAMATRAQLNRQWLHTYSTADTAYAYTIGLYDAGNGNVVMASMINKYMTPQNNYRLRLQKVSPSGATLWDVEYQHPDFSEFTVYHGGRDAAGNLYFSGRVLVGQSTSRWLVISFDDNGVFRWKKEAVQGSLTEGDAHSLAVDASGNVYTGGMIAGAGYYGVLVKYDSNGNELWNKQDSTGNAYATDLAIAANGDVLAAHGDFGITRFSPAGQTVWNTPDTSLVWAMPDLVEGADGGIYAVTYNNFNYLLKKLSASGNLEWTFNDFAEYMAFGDNTIFLTPDAQGNVYVAGMNSTDTAYNTAISKFSPQGTELWRQGFLASPVDFYDLGCAVALPNGKLAVSGQFNPGGPYMAATALLDGNTGQVTAYDSIHVDNNTIQPQQMVFNTVGLYVAGTGDLSTHLYKYGATLSVPEVQAPVNMAVFPNPFGESLTLQTDFLPQGFELLNMAGQSVARGRLVGNTLAGLDALASGTYLLRVYGYAGEMATQKVVKH